MVDDALDKARTAQGTHTPTVEVDPTNELLDGDDKPLPPDLEDADVVVDESGTRLVHVDPAVVPSPTLGNLEVRQLAGKRAAADEAVNSGLDSDADLIAAMREEHRGLKARAKYDTDNKKLTSRLQHIADEVKRLGGSVDDDKPARVNRKDATEGEKAVDEAAKERAAALKADGQNDAAARVRPPTGRRAPRTTETATAKS